MTMQTTFHYVADHVSEKLGHAASSAVALFDTLPEFGAWSRATDNPWCRHHGADFAGCTFSQACGWAIEGDLSAVAASDAMLAQFENYALPTARRETIDDVVGAFPNVPAYLSGQPLCMRRKRKTESDVSPIAILVDVTSSANISTAKLRARGTAILAFARALAARRPVELWAGAGFDGHRITDAAWCFVRLETAPMDLAHVAFALAHPGFARHLCYGAIHFVSRTSRSGSWPFSNNAVARETMRDVLKPAFPHVAEMLCVPAVHGRDALLNDPMAWIAEQLAIHASYDLAA